MYLGRKNQYCENDYTTKCNLQIQCNPYQITSDIFHRTRTKNFSIHMETQKTLNSQSSLENGEGNGTPVQYSCLENPRDGGAWWAAIYGVTQSWTRQKRLSSKERNQR